jgi:hypothetical protein
MPISEIEGLPVEHWRDVKEILIEAISAIPDFSFDVSLVSDANEIGVIHKRIVQNLYTSDLVIVDVSAKNPNVMFELGLRLAFDKPTIIVKDDHTNYSFDTSVIEHLTYPRDLRFQKIVEFKNDLAKKALATLNAAENNPDYSTFLKNLGDFTVPKISEREIPADEYLINAIFELQADIASLKANFSHLVPRSNRPRVIPSFLREEIWRLVGEYVDEMKIVSEDQIFETERAFAELLDYVSKGLDSKMPNLTSSEELVDVIGDEVLNAISNSRVVRIRIAQNKRSSSSRRDIQSLKKNL